MSVNFVRSAVDIDGVATIVEYTEDAAQASTFLLYKSGDYVEGSVASEEFLADPDDMPKPSGRVWYECNGEREGCRRKICYKRPDNPWAPGTVCRRTQDVRAAKNFYQSDDGDWYEMV